MLSVPFSFEHWRFQLGVETKRQMISLMVKQTDCNSSDSHDWREYEYHNAPGYPTRSHCLTCKF